MCIEVLVIIRFAGFTFTLQVKQKVLILESKSLLFYTTLNQNAVQ